MLKVFWELTFNKVHIYSTNLYVLIANLSDRGASNEKRTGQVPPDLFGDISMCNMYYHIHLIQIYKIKRLDNHI